MMLQPVQLVFHQPAILHDMSSTVISGLLVRTKPLARRTLPRG